MAFEIEYVVDFTEKVAPKMVEAGAAVLEPVLKKKLSESIGRDIKSHNIKKSTGALQNSVRTSHPFHLDNGRRFKANIYFDGVDRGIKGKKRKKPIRNNEKAAYKEYGTSRGQEPSNFIHDAVVATRVNVEKAMIQVLEDELKTGGK